MLERGTRIGPYEVGGLIGEGGMGEVYLARDTRLKRDVAIKVLPLHVAEDAERLARFEREAQTLAALAHPNIATIFGLEMGPGGIQALVMQLVDGPTLAERVAHGPIPWRDALAIARQIADGLEAAHEKGIIHRDLKPANIKLTSDGTVKILDFGLAKALDAATSRIDGVQSPTITSHATQQGVILGTAAYMAPEQARGKSVDRRADIWSFGCVLYEILTGRRAVEGDDLTDVLARLLEREPDWTALPADTPSALRRLLERCLTKDPRARLRDIGEARIAIDELLSGKTPATVTSSLDPATASGTGWVRLLPWAVAAIFALVSVSLYLRAPTPPVVGALTRVELNLPTDVEFFGTPSLSADGSRLAFIAVYQGIRQVYLRSFDDSITAPVAGTETATTVTISPDGHAAAFVCTDTRLKRVVFATGIVEPLADGASIYSSAPVWTSDGSIVFSRGDRLVLRQREGGERELAAIDTAAGETAVGWPRAATADTVLFVSRRKGSNGAVESRLEAVPIRGGGRRRVLDAVDQPLFVSAKRLVFERGGVLFAVGMSALLESSGEPMRLAERALVGQLGGVAASVADSGALVAAPPSVLDARLVWVSADGSERVIPGAVRGFQNPRLSPDGRLIAFADAGTIWTLDPDRSSFTRVSTESEATVGFPIWSPDGTRIFYRSAEGIRVRSADGEGAAAILPNTVTNDYPSSITPDGSALVILRLAPQTGGDLYLTPTAGGEITPLLNTNAYEGGAQISPDGKWLLYISDESGRMEVYVRPVSGPNRKWPVSSGGGIHAVWSRDGRRIFYRSGNQFLAVDVTTSPDVRLSAPRVAFERPYAFGQNLTMPNYSLSLDGREFLMVREERGGRHLNLVLNWLQALDRRP